MENEEFQSAETSENNSQAVDNADNEQSTDDAEDNAEIADGENTESETDETEQDPVSQRANPNKPSYKELPKELQERNAKFAQAKREQKREQEIETARVNAVIAATGGINPYTDEKITDKTDVDEYLTMKEIEKQGKDPHSDYHTFVKAKAKEQEQAQTQADKQQEQMAKDHEEFAVKYPGVKFDDIITDKRFLSFANGKLGSNPLTKIYADFEELKNSLSKAAEIETKNQIAKGKASPGALSYANSQSLNKKVSEMSDKEFDEYERLVEAGKIKLKY
jgi:hypothetical protein